MECPAATEVCLQDIKSQNTKYEITGRVFNQERRFCDECTRDARTRILRHLYGGLYRNRLALCRSQKHPLVKKEVIECLRELVYQGLMNVKLESCDSVPIYRASR